MKLLRWVVVCGLFSGACASTVYNKSQKSGDLSVEVSSRLVADLEVDSSKRIQGSANGSVLFGLFKIGFPTNYADGVSYGAGGGGGGLFGPGAVDEMKAAAAYNAVVPAKADVIVAPHYVVKVVSKFFGAWKEMSATVSGFGAKIKSIGGGSSSAPAASTGATVAPTPASP